MYTFDIIYSLIWITLLNKSELIQFSKMTNNLIHTSYLRIFAYYYGVLMSVEFLRISNSHKKNQYM